ncbi:unnamed protein product [Dimorphilus gyrociliatus]|uniref:Uncharacterized protein n=1 Tax=Dimorphilus gyrociliatus TaxID=2664684 RepID=A0A7I8V647_9ANNE|nr:unnamed protein product [Dimorphilus gyrociliatus]
MINSRIQVDSITEEDETDTEACISTEDVIFYGQSSEEENQKRYEEPKRSRKSGLLTILQQNDTRSITNSRPEDPDEQHFKLEKLFSSSDDDLGSENSTSYGIPILKSPTIRTLRNEKVLKINTRNVLSTSSLPSSPILRHKSLSNSCSSPALRNKMCHNSCSGDSNINYSFLHKFQVLYIAHWGK